MNNRDKFASFAEAYSDEFDRSEWKYNDTKSEVRPRIQDSGDRTKFETGAVRDLREGKGRCDLLPLGIIAEFYSGAAVDSKCKDSITSQILKYIYIFMENPADVAPLKAAVVDFVCVQQNWTFDYALMELSKHYEEGAKKYGERNWEKGIPLHCYIDSALRHYFKYMTGMDDEPHDRAFLWNLFGAMWTVKNKPELIDIKLNQEVKNEKK